MSGPARPCTAGFDSLTDTASLRRCVDAHGLWSHDMIEPLICERARNRAGGSGLNTGRTALVTGGSSGIGEAYAAHFLQTGGRVALLGRSPDRLEQAAQRLTSELGWTSTKGEAYIHRYSADVRDADRADAVMSAVIDTFGHLDVLVNNAAGNFPCRAEDLSTNGWNAVVQIVLNGTFFYSRAFGRALIAAKRPGVILNVVASYAWTGGPMVIHSAAAKAGVVAMTKTLAVEWAEHQIRVNAIAPGPVADTGAVSQLWPTEAAYQQVLHSIPAGRLGTREEVASAMGWLTSAENAYLTGEILVLDGGRSLGKTAFSPTRPVSGHPMS